MATGAFLSHCKNQNRLTIFLLRRFSDLPLTQASRSQIKLWTLLVFDKIPKLQEIYKLKNCMQFKRMGVGSLQLGDYLGITCSLLSSTKILLYIEHRASFSFGLIRSDNLFRSEVQLSYWICGFLNLQAGLDVSICGSFNNPCSFLGLCPTTRKKGYFAPIPYKCIRDYIGMATDQGPSMEGKVFKHYFEELEEESVRENFVVVYELLDEMMDFGYPQYTEAKVLSGTSVVNTVIILLTIGHGIRGCFPVFYGLLGNWIGYLISVLYVEYRSRKEKENVNFKNHVIHWFEVLDGLLGPYSRAMGLAFNFTFLLFGYVIQLIACARNIYYYINDHFDLRTWSYISGACCVTIVFIPSFHNYRIWSFLSLSMTTYSACYMTIAALVHGQVQFSL